MVCSCIWFDIGSALPILICLCYFFPFFAIYRGLDKQTQCLHFLWTKKNERAQKYVRTPIYLMFLALIILKWLWNWLKYHNSIISPYTLSVVTKNFFFWARSERKLLQERLFVKSSIGRLESDSSWTVRQMAPQVTHTHVQTKIFAWCRSLTKRPRKCKHATKWLSISISLTL